MVDYIETLAAAYNMSIAQMIDVAIHFDCLSRDGRFILTSLLHSRIKASAK